MVIMNYVEGSSQTPTPSTPIEQSPTSSNGAPAAIEDGQNALPPLPPTSALRSEVWNHFVKVSFVAGKEHLGSRAVCKYCNTDYACNGRKYTTSTSTLKNHLVSGCTGPSPLKEGSNQKTLSFEMKGNLVAHAYNKEKSRLRCVEMIILDELPFSHVEGIGFKRFIQELQPKFDPPSRRTIARDVWTLYQDHKAKLKSVLYLNKQRVSLTTDTWTSIQNINYMVLTAHFIDDGWKLHKRVLNFCQITNHKGEAIGRLIEKCLSDWGIENVFSITCDNASANDGAIKHMKKQLGKQCTLLLNGDFLQMRCCAHILNLIVTDGLNELHDSIKKIRKACKYTRSSPARLDKFRQCLVLEKIDSRGLLPLECKTRWNSTYLMLEAALKLQRGFERLEEEDSNFGSFFKDDDEKPSRKKIKVNVEDSATNGLDNKLKPPCSSDWDYARAFVKFLKRFYEATLRFSASKTVTSNVPFHEMCYIVEELNLMMKSGDPSMQMVATSMKKKFDKYWGKVEEVNQILIVAVVLDPRYKMDYVNYCFSDLDANASSAKIEGMCLGLKNLLMELYDAYKLQDPAAAQSYMEASDEMRGDDGVASDPRLDRFIQKRKEKKVVQIQNEVDKYLLEAAENPKNVGFHLLEWWKENSPRFPILSKVAKDIFSIPVSSVPSESAFSAGKRVVDPFRACLTPKTVEALICTNDWLICEDFDFFKQPTENEMDLYQALEKIEKEMVALQCGEIAPSSSTTTDM